MRMVEIPREGEEDKQMEELVAFMVSYNQLIAFPIVFLNGWVQGKVRIFTNREDGVINGMEIHCIFTDPVTAKTMAIESFKAGVDISDFSSKILSGLEAQ